MPSPEPDPCKGCRERQEQQAADVAALRRDVLLATLAVCCLGLAIYLHGRAGSWPSAS